MDTAKELFEKEVKQKLNEGHSLASALREAGNLLYHQDLIGPADLQMITEFGEFVEFKPVTCQLCQEGNVAIAQCPYCKTKICAACQKKGGSICPVCRGGPYQ